MTLRPLLLSRSAVDRDGERRTRPDLLAELWSAEGTRVLRVRPDGSTPVRPRAGGGQGLGLVPPSVVAAAPPADAVVVYLGREEDGTSYVAVEVPDDAAVDGAPADGEGAGGEGSAGEGTGGEAADGEAAGRTAPTPDERWAGLRDVAPDLDDRDAGLLVEAVGVLNWHRVHPHCPRCGARTQVRTSGWTRSCPVDGSEHYPRTDPAVIMAVVDPEDRVLLAHNALWPAGRYSALAGFVEPGEPLEAAVRREVAEEVGVAVGEVTYQGSQPWPFPASLMLGFRAQATTAQIRVDEVEISAARWFTRAELADAVRTGEVLLPPSTSIALRLVEDWYGEDLPARPSW